MARASTKGLLAEPEPEVIECEQGSEEWHLARCGLVTASRLKDVMAGGEGKMRRKYMLQLAGERLTGRPAETYSNHHMERGKEQEPIARAEHEFHQEVEITPVGFIKRGKVGCSPDGLIGDDGMVEFKSALPDILIDIHLRHRYPPEHRPQCQGNLWVAKRKWIDIVVFCPGIASYRERIYRDDPFINEIEYAVHNFNRELEQVVKQIEALS